MDGSNMQRCFRSIPLFLYFLFLTSCAPGPYLVYSPDTSVFSTLANPVTPPSVTPAPLPPLPDAWEVVDADLSDVTGDRAPEWVLIVARPWRDWPIMTWHGGTSPIDGFRDRAGKSSHLIVLTPEGRERWAGSALPKPMKAVAAGDIDGDGVAEVVTLEGDYGQPRHRPARRIDVWRWDVFGFALTHRSREGRFTELFLLDADNDGILDIIIR